MAKGTAWAKVRRHGRLWYIRAEEWPGSGAFFRPLVFSDTGRWLSASHTDIWKALPPALQNNKKAQVSICVRGYRKAYVGFPGWE